MAYAEKQERFFLAISLKYGKSKGLGHAGMRESVGVGSKKAPRFIDTDQLTLQDKTQIVEIAKQCGIVITTEKELAEQLADYTEWYKRNEPAARNLTGA